MKETIKKILFKLKPNTVFPGSKEYWESRYKKGGTSGAGSYNRLAEFKAEVINQFVKENGIDKVLELGCGDGNQLSLADYPNYIGFDVSPTSVQMCIEKFKGDRTKSFFLYDPSCFADNHQLFRVDLSMSLDVIYHLIEDHVFEAHMRHLFQTAGKYVIIYSSNTKVKQNFHERDRDFMEWISRNAKNWKLVSEVKNKYPFDRKDPDNTSKADFFFFKNMG